MLLYFGTNLYLQSVKVKESTVFSRKYCTELTSLVRYTDLIIYLFTDELRIEHAFCI